MAPKISSPKNRFWRLVNKTKTCWLWTGIRQGRGYGFFHPDGTLKGRRKKGGVLAHRFSYYLTHGKIKNGMCICHKCDNKLCVKPAHLFLGTPKDNANDMVQKKRFRGGTNQPKEHMECPRKNRRHGKYCPHNKEKELLRTGTQRRLRKNGKFM